MSRVINGGQSVSTKTLALVEAAIADLGYHPSHSARSLKGASTKTIGLIVPSVADPFFSTAAAAIQEVARAHGSLVLLAASENLAAREQQQVTVFIQRRVDGLILAPCDTSDIAILRHAGFPVVCFDRPISGASLPTVLSDSYGGAKAATEYLVAQGYRRILCMGGDPRLFTSQKRVRGHRDVLRKAGLPYLAELDVQDYASCKAAILRQMEGRERIDAIFCIKNSITVNAYKILHELRIAIPKEVALLGYDDFELADALTPPITVIRQPVMQIGTRAGEMLFQALSSEASTGHEQSSPRTVTLRVDLVKRASCGELSERQSGLSVSRTIGSPSLPRPRAHH